jgi:NADH dehydrogenase FAD-containing subunit
VVGAGLTGSESALHLAGQGKKVTLIDRLPLDQIETGGSVINMLTLRNQLRDLKVETRTGLTLEAVTTSGVEVSDAGSNRSEIECETVVLALGMEPRSSLVEQLRSMAPEVYVVGDCSTPKGNLLNAVAQGFFAAMEI